MMVTDRRVCVHPAAFASTSAKPRMVYFRWPLTSYPPYNQRLFERLFVRGLSEHFDLVIVEHDCDYGEICERHQPDVTLFESGNNNYPGPYIRVVNTDRHSQIPKLGFMRADPMCPSRTTFYAEMDRWGIETYFTYVTNAGDYLPEIADRLFYWPFAVDPEIYRDYGQDKLMPVLLLGNTDIAQYEWRRDIRQAVASRFQTVVVPHVGYDPNHDSQALYDDKFSRLINAAQITPTCGGMVRCLVNKHLEIPASASLLLTEDTPILREFGFVHMENCVFADRHTVLETLDHLFAHPDEIARITRNGYEHVHRHHTPAQRGQIRQWLALEQQRQPGQRIVQTSMCGDLRLVSAEDRTPQVHVQSGAVDRALLADAWQHVDARRLGDAIELFRRCQQYTHYMAEPRLGLATCHLLLGQPLEALLTLKDSIDLILNHGGEEPDPLEWALWVIALLCYEKTDDAVNQAAAFPALHRDELDRARWFAYMAAGRPDDAAACFARTDGGADSRRSIHARQSRPMSESLAEWSEMLLACGQLATVERIAANSQAPAPLS